ncbi:response regulator [Pseudobacteriovorax antillogorgiicola]|uniref:CheY chemotaxis protein or a CheY-like REC (Receiver) domain n=1 Tax=Pseudobacteriovorax antillogorgiicola TaxID=1513793 RepID=A0A1Y6C853_9BACT|nr:response regulator [Pseudobacteriovorax antillogorgiicola]TCS51814.1 CheY-like chemotaxis protein [Pseudobacteriovorax antillogorgiicola]SMF50204.1 CheY chemotaxis protein or a CheY-like REC (receiver) domain [Pseudobacteriovorax antillogorgiicola]
MHNRFENKGIKIIAVGSSSSIRQVITSVFKEFGYKNVTGVSSIKSALEIIETDSVDWVFTPLKDNDEGNVLQLLQVLNQYPQLRHTKVSAYADDKKHPLAPKCFEFGLFSFHCTALTIAEVKAELQKLLKELTDQNGDFSQISARYLRRYLDEIDNPEETIAFEKAFQEVYPGDTHSLLSLAENQFRMSDDDEAKNTIYQLNLVDPDCSETKNILQHYTGSDTLSSADQEIVAEKLGFNRCLIIDSNLKSADVVRKLVEDMGFNQVTVFDNPIKALPWLRKQKQPDLIISEWQLPILPGPVFLYKIRNRVKCKVPLIIINEEIEARETPMVQELGASQIVAKPIDPAQFQKAVVWTIRESITPRDPGIVKYKLRQALSQGDHHQVRLLKKTLLNNPRMTDSDRAIVEAEIAYENGCYIHSKKHAMEAIHHGGPAPEAMELLGRSLMKLREFDAALRCLQNCSFVSPLNVDHLCNIAECHLENGDNESFEAALNRARSIDDNERVAETEAKGAIQNGHTKAARKLLERLQSFKDVLAYTNNRAVTLIRCGNYTEGINLYKRALDSLPEGKKELDALVRYNLGLAYARHNDLEIALKELKKGENCKNPARRKKIRSLKNRIITSIEKGVPLVLKSTTENSEEQEKIRLQEYSQLEKDLNRQRPISRADYCLHKIYTTSLGHEVSEGLIQKIPSFNFRGKIKKDFRGLEQVPA